MKIHLRRGLVADLQTPQSKKGDSVGMQNVALYYTGICCWCISLGQHAQIVYSPMLLEMTRGATDYKT